MRVVCANTLSMARGSDASKLVRVRHGRSVHDHLAGIRGVMNLADRQFEATAEQYRLQARKGISPDDLRRYVRRVFQINFSSGVGPIRTRPLSPAGNRTGAG